MTLDELYRKAQHTMLHADYQIPPDLVKHVVSGVVYLTMTRQEQAQVLRDLRTRGALDALCMWMTDFGKERPIEMMQFAEAFGVHAIYERVKDLPDWVQEPVFRKPRRSRKIQ